MSGTAQITHFVGDDCPGGHRATAARERPILFSSPMIRALLAGTKTQTRRLIKPQPEWRERAGLTAAGWAWSQPAHQGAKFNAWINPHEFGLAIAPHCPYGRPANRLCGRSGDHLWVRETFRQGDGSMSVHYAADPDEVSGGPWRPSIFMPRWASRLTLEISEVRVQRLQEISDEDARAEGVRELTKGDPRCGFEMVWDSINGKRAPWASNPWVWCLTFRRVA